MSSNPEVYVQFVSVGLPLNSDLGQTFCVSFYKQNKDVCVFLRHSCITYSPIDKHVQHNPNHTLYYLFQANILNNFLHTCLM